MLSDLAAGSTVGIIALPLAMAFGIASIPESVAAEAGISPPAVGLFTAVVAGFLISLLGGSRVQIGGPTGAFVVIVYAVAAKHGYQGLITATAMAGLIIILMGLFRFGAMIKFIPYPVTTGFTSGIAVIIAAAQLKDFFGLELAEVPAEFVPKMQALAAHASTWNPATLGVAVGSLAMLIVLRRFVPRVPGAIVVVIGAGFIVWAFKLPVETISSRFGEIPRTLPVPSLPSFSFDLAVKLLPAAFTIAILASIESLLSAVVADGMTGRRHKADCELVAQGVANIGSALVGGIPATGAIARTVANIKNGGRTPLAGMIHAITLLGVMALFAPLAGHIPLATLAAVLLMVAWNMSELDHFRSLLRAPGSDVLVLLLTFGLTVFTDLTIAVGVGVVMASMLFMKRMADVSNISAITRELNNGDDEPENGDDPDSISNRQVPDDVEVYEINGPFFFGVADRLQDTLRSIERPPLVFILRMRRVPAIDATGLHALEEFVHKCRRQGTILLLSGVSADLLRTFRKVGFDAVIGLENVYGHIDQALARARELSKPLEYERDRHPD
ncbi:MAG TPA: SulP family inorganic anion transporter [Phycisphaerales bacterium]|nr:SulP family inorganic anion transporter [Phycisphaerales bacterium]HRQ74287.1 SulP family inorganic anion transporter [Phycisphaerales bacterium]